MTNPQWLLLMFSLPTKQATARLNVWRQLQRTGAVPIKPSVYILPNHSEHLESFEWISQRVREAGGEANLVHSSKVDMPSGQSVIDLFQIERSKDYKDLLAEVRKLKGAKAARSKDLDRLRRRFEGLRKIDFFPSPLVDEVRSAFQSLQSLGQEGNQRPLRGKNYQGKIWLTRSRPKIDRVASAWLILTFIDPHAKFAFADKPEAFPEALSFDMTGAQFGHEGEDCTFETLVRRFGLQKEAGLGEMAEIIHAADLTDGKFSRTEGDGLLAVLRGWGEMGWSDQELISRGAELMQGLYVQMQKAPHSKKSIRAKK